MRQIASFLTIVTLLLLAAAVDAEKPSIERAHSHNAKRVMAKLRHVATAGDKLRKRFARLHPKKESLDALDSPETKEAKEEARLHAEYVHATVGNAENREMSLQQQAPATTVEAQQGSSSNQGGQQQQGQQPSRDTKPGINSGTKQFFDAPHCDHASTFRVLETHFHEVCSRVDFSFVERHWHSREKASHAFEKFCTSPCAGTINDLLQHTEGYTCFQPDMLTHLRLFSAMCQWSDNKTPMGTDRCGAEVATSGVFDDTMSVCESPSHRHTKATCQSEGRTCQWSDDGGECTERMTIPLITKMCSKCYVKIMDVVASDFNAVCAKQQGQFCMPKLFDMLEVFANHSMDFSRNMMRDLCLDPVMVPCFRAMDVGNAHRQIYHARNTYKTCIRGGIPEVNCSTPFQKVMQKSERENMFWAGICSRNSTGAPDPDTDASCLRVSQGMNRASYMNSCPIAQQNQSACIASCTAENARWLTELGCCVPFLNFAPQSRVVDFPAFDGNVPDASLVARRLDNDYQNFNVANVEGCSGGVNRFDWRAAGCPDPFGFSKPLCFQTNLNLTSLAGLSEEAKDVFRFALKLDIGKNAGVLATNLNLTFVSLPGSPGTDVCFSVRGLPNYINATFEQFNDGEDWAPETRAVNSNHALSYADEAIQGCRHCKPDTEPSLMPRKYDRIPGAPRDRCNTLSFFEGYKSLVRKCSGGAVDELFEYNTTTLTDANTKWSAACNSECLTQFRRLKKSPYADCIPTEVSTMGDLINVGCTKDKRQSYCGAVLTVMSGNDCQSHMDATSCGAAGECRWSNKQQMCKDHFRESFLAPLCDGGCISKMAATIGMNGDSFGKEAKLLDNLFCAHDNGTLCLPLIQDDITVMDEQGTTTQLVQDICTDRARLRCMKRVYSAVASDRIGWAEEEFYHCVEGVMDDSTVLHYQKMWKIESQCIKDGLAATISDVDQTNDLLNNFCSKNDAGAYCLSFPNKYQNHTCIVGMLMQNQCPANCVTEIDTVLTDLGCCAGNLQQVHGYTPFANLPDEDIPEFEVFEDFGSDLGAPQTPPPTITKDYTGPQGSGGSGYGKVTKPGTFNVGATEDNIPTPKWYFMANYASCAGGTKNAGDLVYKKCKKVRGSLSISRDLELGVSYDTISATPKKERRFAKKLQSDLSIKIGCSQDDYPSGIGMKKDSKRKLNIAPVDFTASGSGLEGSYVGPPVRRRQTTSDTDATTSSITIQTENNEDTAASAASYDAAVASGSLTLTSTSSLVKNECNNCTATGSDYTSVSTTTTSQTLTTETNTGSGSGSGSTSATSATASASAAAGSISGPTGASFDNFNGAATASFLGAALMAIFVAILV